MCCYQGKISLPSLQHIPNELFNLFTANNPVSSAFYQCILFYNNALAMTSVGKTIDSSVNRHGRGPYSYVLHGELIHHAGSILPPQGREPLYSQLYIHDNISYSGALDLRIAHQDRLNPNRDYSLDRTTLNLLQGMLHQSHPAVHLYQQAFELTTTLPPEQQCHISLHFTPAEDKRCYNLPTSNEVAVVVIGDGEQITGSQDIIVYRKNLDNPAYPQSLFRISDSHPLYPSLCYILLFPTGQISWHSNILYRQVEDQEACYCFHICPTHIESNHLF